MHSSLTAVMITSPQVQRAEVFYWKVDHPEKFSYDVFPFLIFEDGVDHFYIFPIYEYPGLIKVRSENN